MNNPPQNLIEFIASQTPDNINVFPEMPDVSERTQTVCRLSLCLEELAQDLAQLKLLAENTEYSDEQLEEAVGKWIKGARRKLLGGPAIKALMAAEKDIIKQANNVGDITKYIGQMLGSGKSGKEGSQLELRMKQGEKIFNNLFNIISTALQSAGLQTREKDTGTSRVHLIDTGEQKAYAEIREWFSDLKDQVQEEAWNFISPIVNITDEEMEDLIDGTIPAGPIVQYQIATGEKATA